MVSKQWRRTYVGLRFIWVRKVETELFPNYVLKVAVDGCKQIAKIAILGAVVRNCSY